MSLKIEDVKVGDALEALHKDTVCKCAIDAGLIVTDIFSDKFITSGGFSFDVKEVNLFKKKEQSQYTFDDLIDAAKKAVRDRVLHTFSFGRDLKERDLISLVSANNTKCIFDCKTSKEGVEFIQSLYKETFVIECEEDIRRIKNDANITLSNGNRIEQAVHENRDDYIVFNDSSDDVYTFNFMVLKGATVEQERGRDD